MSSCGRGGGAKAWLHHSEPSPPLCSLLQSRASACSPERRSARDANLRVSRALADMKEMGERLRVCVYVCARGRAGVCAIPRTRGKK